MWSYNHTDELYHYGVPGMKWGVRNFKQEARQEYKRRKTHAIDNLPAAKAKEEKAKALSDYKTKVETFKRDVETARKIGKVGKYNTAGEKIDKEYADKIKTAAETQKKNRKIAAAVLGSIGGATAATATGLAIKYRDEVGDALETIGGGFLIFGALAGALTHR